jgi:hypothetical protein
VEDLVKQRYHPAKPLDRFLGEQRRRPKKEVTPRRKALGWMRGDHAPKRPPKAPSAPVVAAPLVREEPALVPVTGAVPNGPTWGPAARMGRHLRVQAEAGHRAAVIELRPGLFLVAEVPERATRAEFGVVPMLAPLIVKAAMEALGPSLRDADERRRRDGWDDRDRDRRWREDDEDPPRCSPRGLPGPVPHDRGDDGDRARRLLPDHRRDERERSAVLPDQGRHERRDDRRGDDRDDRDRDRDRDGRDRREDRDGRPILGWADDRLLDDVLGCDGGCRGGSGGRR